MLLAEANQWPEDVQAYFGNGDECHMAYHFPLMPRIYMAIAQEDRFPITDIMRQTPEIPANCQWAMFLRNHDELTLEMVTDAERDYLWSTYAADPRARINLGIRRRLAPLMDNDRRKIELMNSILMSMPGTPIIYYGDEIGMGDNIYLGDRNGVRTPMQWTPDRNGGFSRADPARLFLPPIMDPVYGYSAVNVEAQARSLSSLLSWTKRLIGVRKSTKVFGRGTLTFIRPANRAVLAYVRQLGDEAILCVANISRSAQAVELDLSAWKGRIPQEMLGPHAISRASANCLIWSRCRLTASSGSRCAPEAEHEPEKVLPREITTLVLGRRLGDAAVELDAAHLRESTCCRLSCPTGAGSPTRPRVRSRAKSSAAIRIEHGDDRFAVVDRRRQRRARHQPLFPAADHPLDALHRRSTRARRACSPPCAAARAKARCSTPPPSRNSSPRCWRRSTPAKPSATARSSIEFRPTAAFAGEPAPEVEGGQRRSTREQSNTSVIVDNKYVVKILRRITAGIHPEIEVGRFLADVAHFENAPTLARLASSWWRASTAARSRSCTTSSKTRAMPGPSPAPRSTA